MPRAAIGMITPSSNTVLEPVTMRMLAGVEDVSVHFSRFAVTQIGLSAEALSQFDDTGMLRAAELLAHAKVDVICWNGTSAGWLGFETDEKLCRRITEATGIPACTSVLALNEVLASSGVRQLGLVSPYTADVQRKIIENYTGIGIDASIEEHLDLSDNHSFAEVDAKTLEEMILRVSRAKPQAITVLCTNLAGAPLAERLERSLGIPIYDSISVVVWKALKLCGINPSEVKDWGMLFRSPR